MGLTDERFGLLSVAQFELLNERLSARREHDYVCAGIVASTVANTHVDRDKKPEGWSPLDFVPGYKPEKRKLAPLMPKDQVSAFQNLFEPPKKRIIREKV
jgi:hypothetical protein